MHTLSPQPIAARAGLETVEARLRQVLGDERARWAPTDPAMGDLPELLEAFVGRGGKRLRPAFLLAGVTAADGGRASADPAVVDLAAALELLHAFALIHDDVMDGSATRRGEPALHVELAEVHRRAGATGEHRRFGDGLAILAGDLALVYADRLVPRTTAVRELWDELRIELTMGQYLDVLGAGMGLTDAVRARRIATLKSGRYTIVRPLHLAAAHCGRPDLLDPFTRFGDPLGRAFQLRDDVLGAFGDEAVTGKPAGDDLREAKPTLLLALARRSAAPAHRDALSLVGRPDLTEDDIDRIRSTVKATGALDEVEAEIAGEAAAAHEVLAVMPVSPEGRSELRRLAHVVVDRTC
jgi:geranylgeranyl diphosphate synthase, type I